MKISLLFIVFVSLTLSAQLNSPQWTSIYSDGGPGHDSAGNLIRDKFDNLYMVVGFEDGNFNLLGQTFTSNGFSDFIIVKYSPSGTLLWMKQIGGDNLDYTRQIIADDLGSIYICGGFRSSTLILGNDTLSLDSPSTGFISKLDTDGNFLWSKKAGQEIYDVKLSPNNELIICGSFTQPVLTLGNFNFQNQGQTDLFFAKMDVNGTFNLARAYGNSSPQIAKRIAIDSNNNFYLAGEMKYADFNIEGQTISQSNGKDLFIVKFDQQCNLVWTKSLGANGPEILIDMLVDQNDDVIIVGDSYSTNWLINQNKGQNDIFIIKYDGLGQEQWTKLDGGEWYDYATQVLVDDSNDIYVTGYFSSQNAVFDTVHVQGNSGYVGLILKYNPNGSLIWHKETTTTGFISSISIKSNFDIDMTGRYFGDSILLDNLVAYNNYGFSSAFFHATMDQTNTLNIAPSITAPFTYSCYPNPTTGSITIHSNLSGKANIQLVDLTGRILQTESLNFELPQTIDLQNINPGQYILNIYMGNLLLGSKKIHIY